MECVRLRVKDIDFARGQIFVREGKGGKDRVVMLPESLEASLRSHLERVRILHEEDRAAGVAGVYLPQALSVKYPNAGCMAIGLPEQAAFRRPRSIGNDGKPVVRRHHFVSETLQKAVKAAARKSVNCHGCDTPLRRICSRMERIFAAFRNFLAIVAAEPAKAWHGAVLLTDTKPMEMEVRPVKADLQDYVKIGQDAVGSDEKAPPEHRVDPPNPHMDTVG